MGVVSKHIQLEVDGLSTEVSLSLHLLTHRAEEGELGAVRWGLQPREIVAQQLQLVQFRNRENPEYINEEVLDGSRGVLGIHSVEVKVLVGSCEHVDAEVHEESLELSLYGVCDVEGRLSLFGEGGRSLQILRHHLGLPIGSELLTQHSPHPSLEQQGLEGVATLCSVHGGVERPIFLVPEVDPRRYDRDGLREEVGQSLQQSVGLTRVGVLSLEAALEEPVLDVHHTLDSAVSHGVQVAVIPPLQEERRVAVLEELGRGEVEQQHKHLAVPGGRAELCLLYHHSDVVDGLARSLLHVSQ